MSPPIIFVPPAAEKAFMTEESHCFFVIYNYVLFGQQVPTG